MTKEIFTEEIKIIERTTIKIIKVKGILIAVPPQKMW